MRPEEFERILNSESYHWWYLGSHDLIVRVAKRLHHGRRLRVLDAGCGTGRLCQLLAQTSDVTGCDISPTALALANRRSHVSIEQCDLEASPVNGSEYDLITCIDVIYHEQIIDPVAALRNLHTRLRPGGRLILHVPASNLLRGAHDQAVRAKRRFRVEDIRALLRSAGLTPIYVSYRLAIFWLPFLLWRRLTRSQTGSSDLEVRLPQWLHRLFFLMVSTENSFLLRGGRLPFGTSIIAIARRPKEPTSSWQN